MEYGEAIQHLTRAGVSPTSYRWYTIDNIMYFAPASGVTDELTKVFNALFKEVDGFKVYGQYAIDLTKQIVEGAKERLVSKKSRSQRRKEIEDFTLAEGEEIPLELLIDKDKYTPGISTKIDSDYDKIN